MVDVANTQCMRWKHFRTLMLRTTRCQTWLGPTGSGWTITATSGMLPGNTSGWPTNIWVKGPPSHGTQNNRLTKEQPQQDKAMQPMFPMVGEMDQFPAPLLA
ncbi:hypothetical protein NDU88_004397 [Pleurodeles waltl]|uniref:Uncharacterized protein n=1 Tax=Pleurodeles waltl TaxID=8319 RepID=A0AAV7WRR9_PLEWA|nr:hypothetical protein NDU88_004397 [Pleurodeles waltl]